MKFLLKALLIYAFVSASSARPTFDKIAEALLDLVDEPHPRYSSHAYPPHGPLIQEGYDHGYDYYYGGGSSVGGHYHSSDISSGYYPPKGAVGYGPGPYGSGVPPRPNAYPAVPLPPPPPPPGYGYGDNYAERYGAAGYREGSYNYGNRGPATFPGQGAVGGYKSRGY